MMVQYSILLTCVYEHENDVGIHRSKPFSVCVRQWVHYHCLPKLHGAPVKVYDRQ